MILLQSSDGSWAVREARSSTIIISFAAVIAGVAVLILIGAIINRRNRPRTAEDEAALHERVLPPHGKVLRPASAAHRHAGKPRAGLQGEAARRLSSPARAPGRHAEKGPVLPRQHPRAFGGGEGKPQAPSSSRSSRSSSATRAEAPRLRSTTLLRPGQVITITPGGRRPVRQQGHFEHEGLPHRLRSPASRREPTRDGCGARKLSVYLWRDNDAGYSFLSKVLGYDTVKGVSSVLIQHSKTLRREQRRRSRRREIMRACFYYPIRSRRPGGTQGGAKGAAWSRTCGRSAPSWTFPRAAAPSRP